MMNRVLFVLIVFLVLVPIVWKIVMKVMMKIENSMNSPGIDVERLNEQRKSMLDELNQRKKNAEDEASNAQDAIRKLR